MEKNSAFPDQSTSAGKEIERALGSNMNDAIAAEPTMNDTSLNPAGQLSSEPGLSSINIKWQLEHHIAIIDVDTYLGLAEKSPVVVLPRGTIGSHQDKEVPSLRVARSAIEVAEAHHAGVSVEWRGGDIEHDHEFIQLLLQTTLKITASMLLNFLQSLADKRPPLEVISSLGELSRLLEGGMWSPPNFGDSRFLLKQVHERLYSHIILQSFDRMFKFMQRNNGSPNVMCSIWNEVKTGPGILLEEIISGKYDGYANLKICAELYRPPLDRGAVSHVWGIANLNLSDSILCHGPRKAWYECCEGGWNVSNTMLSKRLAAETLSGLPCWMDSFDVPQCCTEHKKGHIRDMYLNYVRASRVQLFGTTSSSTLTDLLTDEWYQRMWVVQECGLARSLNVGQETLYSAMVNAIVSAQTEMATENVKTSKNPLYDALDSMAYIYRMCQAYVIGINPLQDPTLLAEDKKCLYAVDRVYAVANLAGVEIEAVYDDGFTVEDAWSLFAKGVLSTDAGVARQLLPTVWAIRNRTPEKCSIPVLGNEHRPIWPKGFRTELVSVQEEGCVWRLGCCDLPQLEKSQKNLKLCENLDCFEKFIESNGNAPGIVSLQFLSEAIEAKLDAIRKHLTESEVAFYTDRNQWACEIGFEFENTERFIEMFADHGDYVLVDYTILVSGGDNIYRKVGHGWGAFLQEAHKTFTLEIVECLVGKS
ncbi:hypothetical protein HK098_003727 [Nowakowskiella sp. JEL0407]|nr:hypothetical protein HK098_003727 [Nowakowskiella sp. JEL0407]